MTEQEDMRGYRARWRIAEPIPADIRAALRTESVMLAHLLYCRNYRTAAEIAAVLSGIAVDHDPFLLPDMASAVDRISLAASRHERVAVYGDFDCDGIAATAVLVDTLRALDLDPIVYLPSRDDGHGLSPHGLAALADQHVSLVITADCGVNAVDEVRIARGMGMDVIVTDHHEVRSDGLLPDCPILCATRKDSLYPFRSLCGTGVAYKLAQAIRARIPGALDPVSLLDLVALGTVADVVPLVDENRWLVIAGLRQLAVTTRTGLLALFRAAGVDVRQIDPISISFYLAPRINAANRMATPQLAYDLMTSNDSAESDRLADKLSEHNQQRQSLVTEHYARLESELGDAEAFSARIVAGQTPPMVFVTGSWPVGISGLLASKLVDAYGVPAFVGAPAGADTISVSARGIPGAHIDVMLEDCERSVEGGLFMGHGGHARAGGFRIASSRIEEVRALLDTVSRSALSSEVVGAELAIDAELGLSRLSLDAARHIRSLAPFGMGFPEPLFLTRNVVVRSRRPMSDGKHARVVLQDHAGKIDGVAFNVPPAFFDLPLDTVLDVVYHLGIDEHRGLAKPEVRIRDWRIAS